MYGLSKIINSIRYNIIFYMNETMNMIIICVLLTFRYSEFLQLLLCPFVNDRYKHVWDLAIRLRSLIEEL